MKLPRRIATLGPVGHLTPGPGTWGSAAALPLAWLLHALGGPLLLAAATVATLFLGLRAVTRLGETGEEMDRPEIVIDEVVGQWIALAPVSVGAAAAGAPVLALWPGILGAFLAFRLFDIWKPWPVSAFDRRKDAWGVMADDIVAGLYAAIAVSAAAALAHGVFLA